MQCRKRKKLSARNRRSSLSFRCQTHLTPTTPGFRDLPPYMDEERNVSKPSFFNTASRSKDSLSPTRRLRELLYIHPHGRVRPRQKVYRAAALLLSCPIQQYSNATLHVSLRHFSVPAFPLQHPVRALFQERFTIAIILGYNSQVVLPEEAL